MGGLGPNLGQTRGGGGGAEGQDRRSSPWGQHHQGGQQNGQPWTNQLAIKLDQGRYSQTCLEPETKGIPAMQGGAFQAGFPPQYEPLRPSTRILISRNHQRSHEESSFSRPSSQGGPSPMGWGRLSCLEPCAGHGHKFSWQPAALHPLRSRDPILGRWPGSCSFQLGGTWHPIQAMGQGLSVPAHSRTVWPVP